MLNNRLAYLVSRYPAVSHTFILRELRELRNHGFNVGVASINAPDRGPADLSPEELDESRLTFYVKKEGLLGGLAALAWLLRHPVCAGRGVAKVLRLGGWDIRKQIYTLFYLLEAVIVGRWLVRQRRSHLHVHFATPAATVGLLATRLFPVTLSMTVHGPDEFDDVAGYNLREKIEAAQFIVCISHFARSQLMKQCLVSQWSKFEVCRLGVDVGIFTPGPPPPLSDRPAEILCLGRLVPAKGQHILLEAAAALVRRGHRFQLRLVGDGPDRHSLEREAERLDLGDTVRFEGAVRPDRVQDFYSTADLFVLPSFAEGIPVVLMEAMASGVPCISTRVAGISELIQHATGGWLVAPSDVTDLADGMALLLQDDHLRQRLATSARRRVVNDYDLHENSRRLGALFRRRLSHRRAPENTVQDEWTVATPWYSL